MATTPNIEDYLPVVKYNGLNTAQNVDFSGATSVAMPAGTTIGGSSVSALGTITSASATALAVGLAGATNSAFVVDSSTGSQAAGLKVVGATAAGTVAEQIISSGGAASLTIDAKATGTVGVNTLATNSGLVTIGNTTSLAGVTVNGPETVKSAGAAALAVGRQGATNPALNVDASTATQLTGLNIVGKGTTAGVAVSVIEAGGTNNPLIIDAMGSGTISLGTVSTGNIVLGRATTGVSTSMTGSATMKSGTAVPATAGAVAAGVPLSLNSNGVTIECTSDVPTHTRVKGSICINIGGSSTSNRMYVNTDGAGTWTSFTTAA